MLVQHDAPPPKPLSHHWHARWHKAHPEIHSIMTTPLEATRKEAADVHTIKDWFELLRICLANYGIGVRDIWNMDETGFMVGILKKCVVMVPREIKKCYTRNPNNKELITCVECIFAAGEFIPSMIIIKGKKLHYRNFTNAAKEGHDKDTSWCNTKSGYIDSEKSLLWLDHFDRMSRRHQQGVFRLLLLDGHASHINSAFIKSCYDRDIIPFCLPAHSTHILQPLDVAVFQPYKYYHALVTEKGVRAGIYNWGKDDFLASQPWIKQQAFKKRTIISSFKHTGI
jgi:hypothetical protein